MNEILTTLSNFNPPHVILHTLLEEEKYEYAEKFIKCLRKEEADLINLENILFATGSLKVYSPSFIKELILLFKASKRYFPFLINKLKIKNYDFLKSRDCSMFMRENNIISKPHLNYLLKYSEGEFIYLISNLHITTPCNLQCPTEIIKGLTYSANDYNMHSIIYYHLNQKIIFKEMKRRIEEIFWKNISFNIFLKEGMFTINLENYYNSKEWEIGCY